MTIDKISQPLKEAVGLYSEGVTIPQNTNVDGVNNLQTGKTNGQLAVEVLAGATDVVLANAKTITLTVTSSATEGGTFTAVGVATFLTTAITTYIQGDIILSIIIPNDARVLEWTKVNIATDDVAATGTFDATIRRVVN